MNQDLGRLLQFYCVVFGSSIVAATLAILIVGVAR